MFPMKTERLSLAQLPEPSSHCLLSFLGAFGKTKVVLEIWESDKEHTIGPFFQMFSTLSPLFMQKRQSTLMTML